MEADDFGAASARRAVGVLQDALAVRLAVAEPARVLPPVRVLDCPRRVLDGRTGAPVALDDVAAALFHHAPAVRLAVDEDAAVRRAVRRDARALALRPTVAPRSRERRAVGCDLCGN